MIPQTLPGRTPEEQVYLFWRARQKRPRLCKLTAPRRRLLRGALQDYEPRDLCALVVYAYEAEEKGPQWWREEGFLDLSNLLVGKKLAGRMEKAVDWYEKKITVGDEGEELDPIKLLAALQQRVPGTPLRTEDAPATTPAPPPRRRTRRPSWE